MALVLLLLSHCLLLLSLFVGVLCLVLVLLCSTLCPTSFAILYREKVGTGKIDLRPSGLRCGPIQCGGYVVPPIVSGSSVPDLCFATFVSYLVLQSY